MLTYLSSNISFGRHVVNAEKISSYVLFAVVKFKLELSCTRLSLLASGIGVWSPTEILKILCICNLLIICI